MGSRNLLAMVSMAVVLCFTEQGQGQERAPARTAARSADRNPSAAASGSNRARAGAAANSAAAPPQTVIRSNSRAAANGGGNAAPAARPGNGPANGAPQVVTEPVGPLVPPGFPLAPQQQQRVDQILAYWEQNTSDIKTYQCKFVRQNYDFVFGREDAPTTVDRGMIRYAAPDKGLMRVDDVFKVNPEAQDPKERYLKQDVQFGEYWVCDGTAVFQFDSRTKTLTESQLPPDMQGKSIGDGPLPFIFGAKAEKMQARYWIREVPQESNPRGEYFLEAIPRTQEDAANFDRLLIKLAKQDDRLLPQAMRVFKKQQGYVQYEFSEQAINDARHVVQASGFFDLFVRPKTPRGWTKVVEDWSGNRLDAEPQAARPAPAGAPARR